MKATDYSIIKTIEISERFINNLVMDRKSMEKYLTNRNAFTRERKLSFLPMCKLGVLTLKSQYSAQLPILLGEALKGRLDAVESVTKGAYSQRRQLISPSLFRDWTRDIGKCSFARAKKWHGLTVVAFDGTTLQAPDLYDNADVFGRCKNDQGEIAPLLKITILADVLNDMILDVDAGSVMRHERTAAMSMVGNLTPGHLLVLDRGYPSFALFKLLESKGIKFIIRVAASFNTAIREFVKSGKPSDIVTFMSNNRVAKSFKDNNIELPDNDPVKLRVIKFMTSANNEEILVTNLGEIDFPDKTVFDGYKLRWRVEVDYFFLKNEQQWAVFSGYKSVCILQDVYAACVLFNILTLYIQLCNSDLKETNEQKLKMKKPPLKIRRSVALSILCHFLIVMLGDNDIALKYARLVIKCLESTAEATQLSIDRPRHMILRRVRSRHWTDTNYKDSILA